MGPIQISVAIFMVSVAVAMIVWLQSSQAAASARRMMGMIKRVGLDPGTATLGDPRTMAIIKEARRRCRRCPREDLCDRWLAGKVKGGDTFCPNAQTFRILTVLEQNGNSPERYKLTSKGYRSHANRR